MSHKYKIDINIIYYKFNNYKDTYSDNMIHANNLLSFWSVYPCYGLRRREALAIHFRLK